MAGVVAKEGVIVTKVIKGILEQLKAIFACQWEEDDLVSKLPVRHRYSVDRRYIVAQGTWE